MSDVLPSIVVSKVLSYLRWTDKLEAVKAIPQWHDSLCSCEGWPLLDYKEHSQTLSHHFNYRSKVCQCINLYGKYMRNIQLHFYWGVGLGKVISCIAHKCVLLQRLQLQNLWCCRNETQQAFCQLMHNCNRLVSLSLISTNLVHDKSVCTVLTQPQHAHKLKELVLGKDMLREGWTDHNLRNFHGMKRLRICREDLPKDILEHLAQHQLQDLSIYQDEEMPFGDPMVYTEETWEKVLAFKPNFTVNLILRDIIVLRSGFPARAPIKAIVLVDLSGCLTKGILDTITQHYHATLETFVYTKSLSVGHGDTEDKRLPVALLDLTKNCKQLKTLIYGFSISSTTILLIGEMQKLENFVVLYDELVFEMDWQRQAEWTDTYVDWLQTSGSCVDSLELELSRMMGYEWSAVTDHDMEECVRYYSKL